MKYFENPQTKEIFGYDETDPTQISYMKKSIEDGCVDITDNFPTEEMKKNDCVTIAKGLIAQSDWSVLPDVGLANVSEYKTYRSILRELIKNPVANPDWPTEPSPVWE